MIGLEGLDYINQEPKLTKKKKTTVNVCFTVLTLAFKYLGLARFIFMFLKEVSYAQGCIYLIKNTVKVVILYNIAILTKTFFIYILFNFPCDDKVEFFAIITL